MKKSVVALFALVSVLCIPFLSCDVEIGLGSSVDTKAPELTIENPPAGSVIRNVFAITGTCSDDGVIESITVELKQTDNPALSYTIAGTFNQKEGKWSCEVNPLNEKTPIPDGSYEVAVTITDTAQRETIRTRSYTIDNTAPVLAITRPSSVIPTGSDPKKYSNSDSFGQDFVIEGHVADTCERRFISVDVFDMDTKLVYSTLNAEDEASRLIKIDSDFSTTIASFGDEAYTAIYGDDEDAGAKMFFCEITVYDSAKKYPLDGTEPAGENQLGNSVKYFYMYEGELYNTIFDAYGMTNAYKILNGSFSSDDSRTLNATVSPADAKKDLENTAYQETRGFLSLNPKNNPYFKVSGHEALNKDDESKEEMKNGVIFDNTEHHITNNSNIVVEVYPGLDQTPLIQDNLGLYLLPVDVNGKPVENAEKIWLIRPLVDKDGNAVITDTTEIAERNELISKIGSTYKFTVFISSKKPAAEEKNLYSGQRYIFGVQGWDKKGIEVKNAEAVYGFKLVESGTAPALTIKNVTPNWITTNENTPEKPDLVDENAVKNISVTLAFAGDAPFRLTRIVNETEEVELLKSSDEYRETEYPDSYTPPAGSASGTIRYILTSNNDLTSTESTEYYVDNIRPEVVDYAVPSVKETEKPSYKFTGEVSDENPTASSKIAEVQMKLSSVADDGSIIKASKWISVGNTNKWDYTVVFQEDDDFKEIFEVEGAKNIEVRAIDNAGNISEIQKGLFIFDTGSPKLTVQNYKMGNNAVQTIKDEFFAKESFTISGTVSDEYEMKSLSIKQIKGEGNNAEELVIPVEIDEKGNWTVANLPRNTEAGKTNEAFVDTGIYSYIITATDKADKQTNSATYKVTIDLDSPVVEITSPAKDRNAVLSENYGNALSGENFGFSGTMKDNGTGVKDYSYKFVKDNENPEDIAWISGDRAGDSWNIYTKSAVLTEGLWSLLIKATDNAGNESAVAERKFVIDQSIPSLEAEITENANSKKSGTVWYYKGNLSGKIKEADDSFGLDEALPFTFSIGNVDVTSAVEIDENRNWLIDSSLLNFDSSSLENSEKTLLITVHDKVGKTNSTSFTVYKDTSVPQISITYPAENDPISDSQFTARGSITDGTGIGVESLEYKVNQDDSWHAITSGITSTTWTQNFNFEDEPEGKITLSVRAKDMLGNESEARSVTFFYDKQNPQVSIDENDDYYINGTTYTLSGTAYDTNRLSYVTIQDNTVVYSSKDENAGITLNGVETALSAETAANWSKTFTTSSNGILKDGLHTIKVYAYDASNRKSTELTKELFVDTTAPAVISVDTPSAQETEESYYQFSGETRDSAAANAVSANAASGVDKVYVKFTDKADTTKTTGWIEASGTTRWTLLVNYADDTYSAVFGTEGEKTISVKAVDKAGNESAVSAADFIFDKAKPAATVSSYTVGSDTRILGGTLQFDVSDSFSLTGTASDSYKLKKIQIIQRKNDEEDKIVAEITSSESSLNWTVSDLPRAENSLGNVTGTADTETDATYKYAVKVFDASGEAGKIYQTSLLSVRIDKTAPVVEITAPAADLGMNQALSSQAYTFAGSVSDTGVGLEKYQYAFTKTSTAPAATAWTTVNTSDAGLWQLEKTLIDGTQTSSLGLCEGQWYFWFKASDTAGNESNPISRSFYVDRNNPVLSSQITTGNDCIVQSGIYYFKGNLSGTVTASDTNALDKIEFKLGETVINPTSNNGTWTIPATAFIESTLTTLTITAYDVVGKTTVNIYQVYNDTTAPSVNVAESALKENDSISHFPLALYGTFRDGSGIGADVIYYSLDGTDPTNELSVSGSSWTKEIAGTGFAEGNLTLKLKIKDKLNNISETTQIPFYYDISDPSLTETGIGAAGATVHSNITLQGTAGDTNDLAFVEITDSGNTDSTWTINKADMTASSTAGVWTWSQPIQLGTETNKLADGNHTLTIIAEDIAGKQTKITRSIVVDNTVPVIAITKPATDIDKHYSKNSSYTFEGTASDNLGIKSLEAKLYKKTGGTGNDDEVTTADLSVNAGTWKWTVYELNNSSSYYATFEVEDIAGNKATATTQTIVTDFTAPVSTLKVQKNGETAVEVSNNSMSTTNAAYTLSGTVSDTNFDVQTCTATVKADNAETSVPLTFAENTTNWTYTGIAEEGEHTYIFKFSDLAGNENSYTLKVRYDTQAPEVLSITSPESDDAAGANAISGSSKKFTGNAEDNGSGLASYSYVFAQTATPPDAGWTSVNAENGAWEISRTVIATTTPSSECLHEGEWYLFVKATDKAGNTSTTPAMRHFWVDQSAPALTNVNIAGGTYYFNTDALTISGKAIDTNALDENSAVVIKKTGVGSENTNVVLATISAADVAADGSWSANIAESAIPSDGTAVTITIEATDIVGKSSGISTYTVCKDMVAPVVTASPATGAAMAYQKSVNYTFSGTATDTNLEEVTAVLYRNGVPTIEETSLSPKGATGAWEWKVYDLEEAYYSIKITAKDKAGNITEYTTGSVMVDTTAPKTTVNGTALYDDTGTALSSGTEPASLSNGNTIEIEKKYAQSSYTLSGTVTDANFEYNAQSVVLKENGTEKTVSFIGEGTDEDPYTGWSYTPAAFADNTEVTNNYTVTVTDKAGNKTTYSMTVVYDTKAPVLTITSPVNNTAYGTMPPVNGKATDNGIGIKEVKWSNDSSADDSDWSEISWTTLTDWSAELTAMENEGSVTLYVKATDNFGRTSNANVNFSYDLYNPEVTETDTVQEYQKAGYNFTLTGTAGDTNALDCVTITEGAVGYGSTNASDSTETARISTENAAVTLSELSAGTALTAASGKGKNWSISFSDQNQENPQSTLSLSEGSHKLSITAKDTAGKVSTEIIKNIFIDTKAPEVLSVNTPTTLQTANASFRFEGTAKDDTNAAKDSRVKNIQVGFKSYASSEATESTAQTEWLDANGDTSWNFLAVFTDESLNSVFGNNEGYKTICVRAYDYAGNESTVFESPKFLYDRTIPTSSITSYTAGSGSEVNLTSTPSFFANDTFKLNLTANDGYLVKKIVVKQKNSGVTKTVYESDNINLKTTTVDVLNLPRNVSGLDDDDDDATETSALTLDENSSGEYEYSVEVTDVAGKTAEVAKVVAKIDRKVPTITLGTELNAAYYQGLSKTFSFSASDPPASDGSSGSGLSKYYYMFTQDTATQTVSSSGWTEKVASSSFDVIPSLVSGNTLGTNGELNEGQWYLWYYVKDNAGNTSTPTSASFWLDQGAPTLNAAVTPAENSIVGSGTEFYFNSGLSGTISASDSSNVALTLSYKINGGTAVTVTGTSWSIPASSFTAEGTYSLVFTATDQVGRTATKEFTVHKDISAPTLSITSPAAGSYFEQAAINIRGNVRDNKLDEDGETEISGSGVGVNKISYSTDNSTWTELTTYSAGGSIWNDTVSLNLQGNVTLYVKAVDKLGKWSTPVNVSFTYDKDEPVVTETDSVEENQKKNASFTLKGKACDTNKLLYVTLVDSANPTVVYKTDDTDNQLGYTGTIADAKALSSAIEWSKTFSANDLAQGEHTFTISAKDDSNRPVTEITKKIFVDTIPPVVTITAPASFTKSSFVTFNGTLVETNFNSLQIKLYKNGQSEAVETVNVTPQGTNWSYSTGKLTAENTSYYIVATAIDKVGNTHEATSSSIKTDFTKPVTLISNVTGVTDSNANTVTSLGENITYYAKGDYTIRGNITETNYNKSKVTLTAKKNNADPAVHAITASDDKSWSFTGIKETGSYEYNLTIEDEAENTSIYTIKVVYDETKPTVTPDAVSGYEKTSSYEFKGTASDTNFLSLTGVLYKDDLEYKVEGNTVTSEIDVISGNWSWKPNSLPDGTYKVKLTAKDKAGNTKEVETGSIIIDKTAPETSLKGSNITDSSFASATTLSDNGIYYASQSYTISGVIDETNWATGATATYKVNNGTSQDLPFDSEANPMAWTLPAAATTNTYKITLTDSAANSKTFTVTVNYDADAPDVDVKNPSSDIEDPNLALSADKYSFKIQASDNGVGLSSISYAFSENGATAPTVWTSETNVSTGDIYIEKNLVKLHDTNKTNTLTTENLPEGIWYLWFKAKDKAGNESTPAKRRLIVDKEKPVLTVNNTLSTSGTNPIFDDVDSNGYTISGTVFDSNAIADTETIVIKVDNVTKETIDIDSSSAMEEDWSYTIPKGTEAGTLLSDAYTIVEVIAKDTVGKTTDLKYTLFYDTKTPELAINAPVEDEQVGKDSNGGGSKIIKGTVSDEGYGLAKIEFELRNSSNEAVKDGSDRNISGYWSATSSNVENNYPLTVKGEQWYYAAGGNSAAAIPLGTSEGELKLWVKATEKQPAGHTAKVTEETIRFYFDKDDPVIEETKVGTSRKTINTHVELEGIAYDTNKLNRIEIKEGSTLKATTESNPAEGVVSITFTSGTLTGSTSSDNAGTWNAAFADNAFTDGEHTFTITAYDISGKSKTLSRSVLVDKTLPTIDSNTVTSTPTEINSTDWYGTRSIQISVTASDKNASNIDGSGVETVEYSKVAYNAITSNTDSAETYRSWQLLSGSSGSYSGFVTFDHDGMNKYYIRVKDVAGNYRYDNDGTSVYIDYTAPASADLISVDGEEAGEGEGKFAGTKLTNGNSNITFNMTAGDDITAGAVGTGATGIGSIKIIKIGTNALSTNEQIPLSHNETTGEWSAEIPKNKISSGNVDVRVTDAVGNYSDYSLFLIDYDNRYPSVSKPVIGDADNSVAGIQVNGVTKISGTASDNRELVSVQLQYSTDGGSNWINAGSPITEDLANWSTTFDVTKNTDNTAIADGTTILFRAIGKDKAGNEGNSGNSTAAIDAEKQISVKTSEDSDRPIIRINNLAFTGMSSENAIMHKRSDIYGTISDDDGDIQSIKASVNGGSTWTDIAVENGSWTHTLSDGPQTLLFKVKDKAGEEFVSSDASNAKPYGPKIIGKDGVKLGYKAEGETAATPNNLLYLRIDTHIPKIPEGDLYYIETEPGELSDAMLANPSAYPEEGENKWKALTNISGTHGGIGSFMYLMYKVTDNNGIKSSTVRIGNHEITINSSTALDTLIDNVFTVKKIKTGSETNESNETVEYQQVVLKINTGAALGDGALTLSIIGKDNADSDSSEAKQVILFDNEKPTIQILSHQTDGMSVYGSLPINVNGNVNEVSSVWFALSKDENEPAESAFTRIDEYQQTALSWKIVFDNSSNAAIGTATEYHTDYMNTYVQSLHTVLITNNYNEINPVWLWMYAVDSKNNKSEPIKRKLNVIPQGDKPNIEILYPTFETDNASHSVGGTIRVTGSSDIAANEIAGIYLQIDPSYDGNDFNSHWEDEIAYLKTQYTTLSYSVVNISDEVTSAPADLKGIKANGLFSWSLTLNQLKELNSKIGNSDKEGCYYPEIVENGESRKVAVRAYAVSKTGKVSDVDEIWFTMDPDSPTFGESQPLQLVQYDSENNIKARRPYESGMYINGLWYLIGSVEDEAGISKIIWTDKSVNESASGNEIQNNADWCIPSGENYYLNIPVGNNTENGFGTLKYQIEITDKSSEHRTNSTEIFLRYDNKAPDFEAKSSNVAAISATEINSITQSDGTYSLNGTFGEASSSTQNQSGFNRIAMYFTREGTKTGDTGTNEYLVDPMQSTGDNGDANWYKLNDLRKYDGMYWIEKDNASVDLNELTLTLTDTDLNVVRVGALCRVNEVAYRINVVKKNNWGEDATEGSVTLTLNSQLTTQENLTVYFGLAQIIDNTVREAGTTNLYNKEAVSQLFDNDDGDQMVEGVTDNGASASWNVSIDSRYIYDGPVKLNFVAYDNAGNYKEVSYDCSVNNNGPRLAGLLYGTDDNGSGEVEDNELKKGYHNIYANGVDNRTKVTSITMETNASGVKKILTENDRVTVKGAFKVVPEIVGGNRGIGYSYKYIGKNEEDEYVRKETAIVTKSNNNIVDLRNEATDQHNAEDMGITISVRDFLRNKVREGEQILEFTIYDHTVYTEDPEQYGADTNKAYFDVPIDLVLTDTKAPKAWLKPFYWKKLRDNSIYDSANLGEDKGISDLAGHIELESDWITSAGHNYADANVIPANISDDDPKVSGKVSIKGAANDNVLVKELYIKIPTLNGNEGFVKIAERITAGETVTDGWHQLLDIEGESTNWYSPGSMETNGWEVSGIKDESSQDKGNTVEFTFSFDSSRITDVAAANVTIQVQAKDRGSVYNYDEDENGDVIRYLYKDKKSSEPEESTVTTTETNTSLYRIDIVPYITKIETKLSSLKKKNWSVYSRTALGHYPVADTETIKLYGFNLFNADGTIKAVVTDGLYDSTVEGYQTHGTDETNGDYVAITIPNMKSGNLVLNVSSIPMLNNFNNNNAIGGYDGNYTDETYAYAYNRIPNKDNNNRLTDDVVLDVWEFHSNAVVPISGNIEQPQMKINPVTGQLGFAFVNGPLYFSMPGKIGNNNYSYQYWCNSLDFFTSVGLAYDANGHSYAVAAGGDINVNTADKFVFMTDIFGKANENKEGYSTKLSGKGIRIESVGMIGTKGNTSDTTKYFEKQRIKSSSLATSVHDDNTNVYLAYYDSMTDEIRFKYGNTGNIVASNNRTYDDGVALNATQYRNWYIKWKRGDLEGTQYSQTRQLLLKHGFAAGTKVEVRNGNTKLGDYEIAEDCTSEIQITDGKAEGTNWDAKANVVKFVGEDMDPLVSSFIKSINPEKTEEEILGIKETVSEDGLSVTYSLDDSNWTKGNKYKTAIENIKVYSYTTGGVFDNFQDTEVPDGKTYPPRPYNVDNVSLIAGEGTGRNAGEYVSIGVTQKSESDDSDVVVVVWFDQKNRCLKYAYNDDPTTDRAGVTDGQAWKGVQEIFANLEDYENAGEYCQLAVDANGGIHIAAYDGSNSDIVYAYLESYSDNNPKVCVVDSAGVVGSNLTIDVALNENNKAIPRISYYSNSCVRPKLAYLVDTTTSNPAGAIEEEFTGKWEVTVVPIEGEKTLNMQSAQYNKINVAVWKTAEGVITTSNDTNTYTPGTETAANNKNTLNAFNSDSYGFVYGNGTSNAVLGYAVKDGSGSNIETAQMK